MPRQSSNKSKVVNITAIHTLKAQAVSVGVEEGLEHRLARFWELESLGIAPQEKTVYDRFEDTIQFVEGRHEVKMPWKEPHPLLPDNYGLARNRFNQLLLKLCKDRQLLLEFDELIKNQLKSGVMELMQTDSFRETGRVHYIPQHPVIRRDKDTTKVTIVYDARAREGGTSLNDCLHAGPSLLPKIMDILIRSRFHKVALVSDVEKAFHQVLIARDDRDVLRFLWIDNPVLPQPRVTVYRFARAVFGVNSSPFLLTATIAHHINSYSSCDPGFVEKFLSSPYVDDFSGGAGTTADAYELYLKAHKYMLDGRFNLRKWQ